jgi:alpha-amylase
MTSVCFYFQVHQPFRLRRYAFHEIGHNPFYEDEDKNSAILNKVAEKCYLPANALLLDLIHRFEGRFRVSFSLSGVVLEQMERYRPDVLASFQALVASGAVELLSETHYHSLAALYSPVEFQRQVAQHRQLVERHFHVTPTVFRNTELIYSDAIGSMVHALGFKGQLAEGVDRLLQGRSPAYVYKHPSVDLPLLLKQYSLSDDVAFRFSDKGWPAYPLTAETYASWLHALYDTSTINLFMDYETFGEHQWAETGIFEFMRHLPEAVLRHQHFAFHTPSEVLSHNMQVGEYAAPVPTSWADAERDLSAWLENDMQRECMERIYSLEDIVKRKGDPDLLTVWGKLQTSDHFYYMSTKFWADGDVHKYFSPYDSPYDACLYYRHVWSDFEKRLGL